MVKFIDGVKTWQKDPQLIRERRANQRRENRKKTPLTPEQKATQQKNTKRLIAGTRKFISLAKAGDTASRGANFIMAASATWLIISITWILYLVQFVLALLSIFALTSLVALDYSWAGYADFFGVLSGYGELFLFLGMILSFVMGAITFLIAVCVYVSRGVDFSRSWSIFVAAFCFSVYILPGFNLIPWCWFWGLYVVKSQID